MNIGLVDVDSHNFPNLCLMKLSAWHKSIGDTVEWCDPMKRYDLVYQSRVFNDSYSNDIDWIPQADEVIKGGTGYGLDNKLSEAVEHIYPDYSLYGITDTAYGFLTRGCPRGCGFCIVAEKEGRKTEKVADLSEFWRGQPKIEILDPNLLACDERMDLLEQLVRSRAMININQGFDIRLTNEAVAEALGRMRIKRIHFAWDDPKADLRSHFEKFASWYRRKSASGKCVYVLTNFGSTLEQDLYRINTLNALNYDPYVMVYDKPNAPKVIKHLQRWCNSKMIFRSCSFDGYLKSRKTI